MNHLPIDDIISLLAAEYGTIERHHRDPLSELILTVLSQNTSDSNSRRAYDKLVHTFSSWESVARADAGDIAGTIRTGGLSQVKALRIKEILEQIRVRKGSYDLDFLSEMPLADARAWLQTLPGVGPKTAACVLLFSLGKPVLPVDTHIYRVARRLGLIDSKVSVTKAHDVLGAMVPAEDIYQFHMRMVEHGRKICKARQPFCHQCVLLKLCPTGRTLLGIVSN